MRTSSTLLGIVAALTVEPQTSLSADNLRLLSVHQNALMNKFGHPGELLCIVVQMCKSGQGSHRATEP